MTMPQIDAIGGAGAVTQIVNNTTGDTVRYLLSCNTQAYLGSQNTVSATSGLFCGAGSTLELLVAAGGGVWAYGAGATEVTIQQST